MSKLKELQAAKNIYDLARLLSFKAKSIAYILYKKNSYDNYNSFDIPKKNGGVRVINSPSPDLKLLQKNLSDLIQDCLEEYGSGHINSVSHGFLRGKSIASNAYSHRRKRYVFNIDLNDFFGSVNFGRVRGYFISDNKFKLSPAVATIIAQIACSQGSLPQGSPSSPVISNLIGNILDVHLLRLAKKERVQYTRYADDITFSTNLRKFPESIAVFDSNGQWIVGSVVEKLIKSSGFDVNPSKTRMQYKTSRQEVTGLVVNKRINVPFNYRHKVRAMVHNLFKKGEFFIDGEQGSLDELHGMLSYIHSIDCYSKNITGVSIDDKKISSNDAVYKAFLLYKEFYAAKKPVIICEGKTDNIYLKLAINSLAVEFPNLIEINQDGSRSLSVRIYRYLDTTTGKLLGVNGGTGDLSNLMSSYIKEARKFAPISDQKPFIFLIDNDSGATGKGGIFNTIKNLTRGKVVVDSNNRNQPFFLVDENLFVVPTPLLINGADSQMEDFFDEYTRSLELNGKIFNPKNQYDTKEFYGKNNFANNIILKNSENIDFGGFRGVLTRISEVVNEFG